MGLDNPIHIAFLLILVLIVFGAKRLPEMGKSLGEGMRGFRDSISGHDNHTTAAAVTSTVTQPTVAEHQATAAASLPLQAVPAPMPTAASAPTHQDLSA